MRLPLFPVLASLLACMTADAAQTVYRYRAFAGSTAPNTVSNYVAGSTQLPPVTSINRGPAGGPFRDFQYATFSGTHQVTAQAFNLPGALSGDFTVSAHVRIAPGESGTQTLMSTWGADGSAGISLQVLGGTVHGRIALREGAGEPVARLLTAPVPLVPGRWIRVTYRYQRNANGSIHTHDLWLDEHKVATATLAANLTRADADLAPVFGATRDASGFTDHLRADLFAIQIDDYALRDRFLNTPLIRDGSDYFGMISHHDYLGTTNVLGKLGGSPLEKRIIDTAYSSTGAPLYAALESRINQLWFLPFMNDDYVPQGFAADPEGGRVFLAYYHRTREDTSYTQPNMIAEVFLPEGRLGNVFLLRTETNQPLLNSHMGGIAYWNGFLFAPNIGTGNGTPTMFAFDISEQAPAVFDPDTLAGFSPVQLRAIKRYNHPQSVISTALRFNTISFMGVHYDAHHQPFLHIGNFDEAVAKPTHVFKLSLAGDGQTRDPILTDPVTHMQSHRRAQGMAFYHDLDAGVSRARRTLLSNSWGNGDSFLYNASYAGDSAPQGGVEWLRLPAGFQDLGRMGNDLLTWSESGATYYQKRASSPWTKLYPFLVAINMASLRDPAGRGIPDEWYQRHSIGLSVHPSTDLDGDGFSIRDEYLWDTDPRNALSHPGVALQTNPLQFQLPTSSARFYTLLHSDDLVNWLPVPSANHRRGTNTLQIFPATSPNPHAFFRFKVSTD